MVKLPVLSGEELVGALKRASFVQVGQKGSHVSLHKGKLRTVVPLHRELSKGTLAAILRQCGLSKEGLMDLLKK